MLRDLDVLCTFPKIYTEFCIVWTVKIFLWDWTILHCTGLVCQNLKNELKSSLLQHLKACSSLTSASVLVNPQSPCPNMSTFIPASFMLKWTCQQSVCSESQRQACECGWSLQHWGVQRGSSLCLTNSKLHLENRQFKKKKSWQWGWDHCWLHWFNNIILVD